MRPGVASARPPRRVGPMRDDERRSEERMVLVRRAEVEVVERSLREGSPVVLTGAAGSGAFLGACLCMGMMMLMMYAMPSGHGHK